MSGYTYGQREQMENEAMARTLDTQARAIWPQEKPRIAHIFAKNGLQVLDVGCGTGEISSRIILEFSPRSVVGVDVSEANLARASARYPSSDYPGLSFQEGNAIDTTWTSSGATSDGRPQSVPARIFVRAGPCQRY